MKKKEIELKKRGIIKHLTNKTFQFSRQIKKGLYSANYFLKTQKIIKNEMPNHQVTMQFFQRKDDIMLCGIDESIALIRQFAKQSKKITIEALNDGDIINANEPVLKITGKYENFGFLESLIDGILSRRSSVATNVYQIKKNINRKCKLFSMADRQDDYLTQTGDGYATYVAGVKNISTDAQGLWWNGKGIGTMPHALIQMCQGDIIKAIKLFKKNFPHEKIIALVDYHNNVIKDSLKIAKIFGKEIYAVRIDTSISIIDHYFDDKDTSNFDPHGVCKELIFALRDNLNKNGYNYIKIMVSSDFNLDKIKEWTKLKVPVDSYGIGKAFVVNNTTNFTGDLVILDNQEEAKYGRNNIISERLKKIK